MGCDKGEITPFSYFRKALVAARSVSNDEHGHESRRRGCEYVGNLEPAESCPHIHSPPGRPKAISVLAALWSDESVPPPPYRVREHAEVEKTADLV